MDIKGQITDLYFNKKYKNIEIARNLNIDKGYVTRILKQDPRYLEEKSSRKTKNKVKNINKTKQYIKQKREAESILNDYVKQQHIQAMIELSGGHGISNRAFRKWNSSAYNYNEKKQGFVFNRKLGRSYAVPKFIR